MRFIRPKYIIILCFFAFNAGYSQNLSDVSGSTAGMGVAQATVAWNDEHASANNQAGMLGTNNYSFQLSAARLWGVVNVFSASASKKLNDNNAIGISIKHIGDQDLNNQVIGVSYARKILKNWDIGLQLDALTYQTRAYGSRYLGTVEIGSIFQATKNLRVGFHVFNPFGTALSAYEDIPAIIRLGVLYGLSEKVELVAEVEQQWVLGRNLKAGIQYEIVENLRLRAGFATAGTQLHFGLSYGFGNFKIHGSSSLHTQLGITPSGEISFQN